MTLSKTIKLERVKANLNQGQLAEKIGIKQSVVSKMENGHQMRMSTIQKFLDFFGLKIKIVRK